MLADEKCGGVPGAVVHYRAGDHLTDDELCAYLAAHIAAFKLPARIWVAPDPLPRLGTEKNDKVSLRAHSLALAAAEGRSPLACCPRWRLSHAAPSFITHPGDGRGPA